MYTGFPPCQTLTDIGDSEILSAAASNEPWGRCGHCKTAFGVPTSKDIAAGVARCINPNCPRTMELEKAKSAYPEIRCAGCGHRNFLAAGGTVIQKFDCNHGCEGRILLLRTLGQSTQM